MAVGVDRSVLLWHPAAVDVLGPLLRLADSIEKWVFLFLFFLPFDRASVVARLLLLWLVAGCCVASAPVRLDLIGPIRLRGRRAGGCHRRADLLLLARLHSPCSCYLISVPSFPFWIGLPGRAVAVLMDN